MELICDVTLLCFSISIDRLILSFMMNNPVASVIAFSDAHHVSFHVEILLPCPSSNSSNSATLGACDLKCEFIYLCVNHVLYFDESIRCRVWDMF